MIEPHDRVGSRPDDIARADRDVVAVNDPPLACDNLGGALTEDSGASLCPTWLPPERIEFHVRMPETRR